MFNADRFFDARRVINEHTVETNKTSQDRNEKYYGEVGTQAQQQIVPLFPSFLLVSAIPDAVQPLTEAVAGESQSQDTNAELHSGRNAYQSDNDLHKRYEVVQKLMHAIEGEIKKAFNLNVTMTDSWLNVNLPGGFNYEHTHGGHISGCYYVHVPPESGDIVLTNPAVRGENIPVIPKYHEKFQFITPETGDLLVFPSWVTHRVEPNKSGQNRISIAFNGFING